MNETDFELKMLHAIVGALDEVIYVADPETHELLYLNQVGLEVWGDIVGDKCYKGLQNRNAPCPFCTNDKIFGEVSESPYVWEFQNEVNKSWYRCIDKAIDWPDGRRVRFEMAVDITKQKVAEELIRRQADEIMEMSTPVVQVWKGVVIAPLIGTLDSRRTQHFMERFLDGITKTESPVALLDITGVPMVDTQTAQHLLEAISAARLLGTTVILTGVRPAIAQTLVHLGIDLAEIETQSSLAAGLRLALKLLNVRLDRE